MPGNYLKIAWRNLFRNKLHTFINITGLIIGFTIGIAILLVALAAFIISLMTISMNTIRAAMQNPVESLRTE